MKPLSKKDVPPETPENAGEAGTSAVPVLSAREKASASDWISLCPMLAALNGESQEAAGTEARLGAAGTEARHPDVGGSVRHREAGAEARHPDVGGAMPSKETMK